MILIVIIIIVVVVAVAVVVVVVVVVVVLVLVVIITLIIIVTTLGRPGWSKSLRNPVLTSRQRLINVYNYIYVYMYYIHMYIHMTRGYHGQVSYTDRSRTDGSVSSRRSLGNSVL